jgi:hypothetical protein
LTYRTCMCVNTHTHTHTHTHTSGMPPAAAEGSTKTVRVVPIHASAPLYSTKKMKACESGSEESNKACSVLFRVYGLVFRFWFRASEESKKAWSVQLRSPSKGWTPKTIERAASTTLKKKTCCGTPLGV